MKNENRAAFGRAPEPVDYAFDLPPDDDGNTGTKPPSEGNPLTRLARRLLAWKRRLGNAFKTKRPFDKQLKDIGISRCQAWGGYSRYRRSTAHDLERHGR